MPDPAPANLQRLAELLRGLIAMKRAAGRPRDLDDLARLTGA